ncbi:MAG: DUF1924 domain-containing protein [Mariprofundaceae bacterium]|nr:DUF1924 domain-containing protein [Mariprofundaceae bacterium]
MMKKTMIAVAMLCLSPALAQANVIPELLETYKSQGASNFSAKAGQEMWTQVIPFEKKGEMMKDRSCATCHNAVPNTVGKHKKTGKEIAAMTLTAFSINKRTGEQEKRYSTVKKVEKWFKRNCKWTYGRVCTPQEKGDFLMFFKGL